VKDIFKKILDLLGTVVLFSIGIPMALVSPIYGHKILKIWAKYMAWLYRVQIEILDENQGRYPSSGILYLTLNQTSLSEGFIGTFAIPTPYRPIMNLQMALYPIIGWFYWSMRGVVLIQPWKSQSKAALSRAAKTLRHSANFWMSIEGRRSRDGTLSPYKKGAAVLAIQAQAKIVPIMYSGAREILPFGEWRIQSGQVKVVLGKIISTEGLTYDQRDRLVSDLRALAESRLDTIGNRF
jgi:1-acyl-sn-glycerol-3-phosphate acyltransferase